MTLRALLGSALLVAFALGASISAADAQIQVFNSFGTNFSNIGNADCIAGADNAGCFATGTELEWIAAPFSPSSTGKLDFIDVGATYDNGTNGVVVTLVADNGGSPSPTATVLETFTVTKLPVSTKPKVKLTSKLNPTLTAGQHYWLIMAPLGYDGLNLWYLGPSTTSPDISGDGGTSWNNYGDAPPDTNTPTMAVYIQ